MKLTYTITPEMRDLGLRSAVVAEMSGLRITPVADELDVMKAEVAADVVAMSEDMIAASPVLRGYRELVQGAGRSLKKFPPAAENLIRQVRRTGRLPAINTAVDSYNIVVCRRGLALGVHDQARLSGGITFRRSPGAEPFTAVGGDTQKLTQPGDFVYADAARVLAWFDSKDSDEVKVSIATTDLLIVVQGTAQTDREYTHAAAEEACRLIQRFCGGTYEIAPVD